jgi:hypothetical protein
MSRGGQGGGEGAMGEGSASWGEMSYVHLTLQGFDGVSLRLDHIMECLEGAADHVLDVPPLVHPLPRREVPWCQSPPLSLNIPSPHPGSHQLSLLREQPACTDRADSQARTIHTWIRLEHRHGCVCGRSSGASYLQQVINHEVGCALALTPHRGPLAGPESTDRP